jgi:ferredoxin
MDEELRSVVTPEVERTQLEPELGGALRSGELRSGLEPELGGALRQQAVWVDELTCIGCRYCAHVATNTFYIEPDYGRSRVVNQNGDSDELVQEAMDTCPVNCIHWVSYKELRRLEEERRDQVILPLGLPMDTSLLRSQQRRRQRKRH